MTKIILLFGLAVAFVFFIYPIIGKSTSTLVLINMPNAYELPRNFRIADKDKIGSDRSNLSELNASASGQFSTESLKKILSNLPTTKVTILDLREESHGFINGEAICWYGKRGWSNRGKTLNKILRDENFKLSSSSKQPFILAYRDKTLPVLLFPQDIYTEEELAHSLQINYVRLPVTDHGRPSDEIIDQFVQYIKQLPEDMWLHFHCSAGKGRATTFLVMYDMMRHAHETPFKQIIKEHEQLGGINLLALPQDDFWKHEQAEERANFIRSFYKYCVEIPDFREPWTTWYERKWAAIND